MNEYLDDFVPCLHNILRDQTMDRRIKLPALHALGDLCMFCGDVFNAKFLDSTLSILSQAARTSTGTAGLDVETLEFLSELREVIIDSYIIIVMAAADSNCLYMFKPYLDAIFEFAEKTVGIEGPANPKVLKLIIALVGDIATNFKEVPEVKAKVTLPYIEQSIIFLQSQSDAESKDQAAYTLNAIKSLLQ